MICLQTQLTRPSISGWYFPSVSGAQWMPTTLCNIFSFELIMGWQCTVYKLSIYMECGDTPHFVISIWMQLWIWIQSVGLHGVWRHSTLHNIHMDTDMDMDTEYGSTWSVETLYIPSYPYGHRYGSIFTYYHCYIL